MPCYRENRIKIALKNNASKFAHSPPSRQNDPNSRVFKGYFSHDLSPKIMGTNQRDAQSGRPFKFPSLESKGYG